MAEDSWGCKDVGWIAIQMGKSWGEAAEIPILPRNWGVGGILALVVIKRVTSGVCGGVDCSCSAGDSLFSSKGILQVQYTIWNLGHDLESRMNRAC